MSTQTIYGSMATNQTLSNGLSLFYFNVPLGGSIVSAKFFAGTAGTGSDTTFDITKNGVSQFTTKPILANGATTGATQAANGGNSFVANDRLEVTCVTASSVPPQKVTWLLLLSFTGATVESDTTLDPNLPSAGQKSALAGTSGTPSGTNKYVTNDDTRVPTQAENDALVGTSGSPNAGNPFVTTMDNRIPTQDENDALNGTAGMPSLTNKYVTNDDTRIPSQDENDALVGSSGTPSSSNKYVTEQDTRIVNIVTTSRSVSTQHSLTGGGNLSADRTLNLVNDTASPGNARAYNTGEGGTRGWNRSRIILKYTKTYANFSTAGTVNSINLVTLPAGAVVHFSKIKHTAPFSGGGFATYTVEVGEVGDTTKYNGAFDVMAAVGDTTFDVQNHVAGLTHNAGGTIIQATARTTVANLNTASAGSVDIWIEFSVMD